jgi:hypothetical protein
MFLLFSPGSLPVDGYDEEFRHNKYEGYYVVIRVSRNSMPFPTQKEAEVYENNHPEYSSGIGESGKHALCAQVPLRVEFLSYRRT